MSNIVGTVIDVKRLYGNAKAEIKFENGTEQIRLISLKENRVYKVPFFQREIRWTKENLTTLINDVEKNPKFLGNLIFTKDDEGNYDILDGQQRSTIILLLLQYIRKKYGHRIEVFPTCKLEICSFSGFNKLYDTAFDLSSLSEHEIEEIKASDDYKQMVRYQCLWNEIAGNKVFSTVADAESFVKNLEKCEVNVIVNTESIEYSIDCFLDVNLKGVKLDTEDIFKSYLCAQDNSEEIHIIWSRIKKLDSIINEEKKGDYPFMTILEHYFRCVLAKKEEYREIDFNSDFTLKSEKEIEGKVYSAGEHIVKVIHDKNYLRDRMKEFELLMKIIANIIAEENPTTDFKKYFVDFNQIQNDPGKKIDQDEIAIIYNLVRKILLDKNKVPKCLVAKYVIEVLLGKSIEKEDYQKVYGVFAAAVLFTLYETRKGIDKIYRIVKQESWYREIVQYVNSCFLQGELSNRQIIANYKFVESTRVIEKKERQEFRCKSLATIYNFLNITADSIKVKKHKMKELNLFLNDSEKYSVEHFILNQKGNCLVELANGEKFDYTYPDVVIRYIDSLFNYIFISRDNNNLLGNAIVTDKLNAIEDELEGNFRQEKCEYSQKVIELAKEKLQMPDLSTEDNIESAKNTLDQYYQMSFRNRFFEYATALVGEISG